MTFATAHKFAAYLMLGSAFVALAGGGTLDPLVLLLGTVGLTTSWWIEPPRFALDRHQTAWNVASVLALLYALMLALSGDVLSGGVSLIVFLSVAKACQRRTNRDWGHLAFLSVAMLIGASVLNTGMLFGVCFLIFVIASTWAFVLLHLRRDIETNFLVRHDDERVHRASVERIFASRRIVDRRFFTSTAMVSLVVFAAAVLLFLSIPRVGFGFLGKSQQGITMVGFSDGVELGGHGTLKRDETVVMRVKVDTAFEGRAAPSLHWRGVAFDRYSNGQWSRSKQAPRSQASVFPIGRNTLRRESSAPVAAGGSELRQEIWLEPMETNVLFAASTPLAFEYDAPPRPTRFASPNERNDEVRLERKQAIRYVAYSRVGQPDPTLMRQTGKVPESFEVYLQIPDEVTERTRALARTITADADTDYDRVLAIMEWLRTNATYTTTLTDHGDQEPIDAFLFQRKQGHCEYFATAFVILARAAGVHARQVNGFLGGEWNEYDRYIAVRAGDAHSWAEVYFPAAGWVTFDPTPSGADVLGRGSDSVMDKLRRFMDSLRFQWSRWVVDYSLGRQVGLVKDVGAALKSAAQWTKSGLASVGAWALAALPYLLGGAGLLAILFGLRQHSRRTKAPAHAHTAVRHGYERALALLARLGHARAPSMTPREFAQQVCQRDRELGEPLRELTELYYLGVWGRREVEPSAMQGWLAKLQEIDSMRRAPK